MNNYQTKRTPSTSSLNLGLMATLLLSSSAIAGVDAGPQPQRDILNGHGVRMYTHESASPTYASHNSFAQIEAKATNSKNIEAVVSAFYTQLSSRQVNLDHDFASVLFEDMWDLYSE